MGSSLPKGIPPHTCLADQIAPRLNPARKPTNPHIHLTLNPDTAIEPLLQIVNAALADATARSGPWLACRPGCAQCCHGTFPISALDADRLRTGLANLTQTDPARAGNIRDRAHAATTSLEHLVDPTTGHLLETEAATEAFDNLDDETPCPALDPATQTCDLYADRPILCRTFGPPLKIEPGSFAVCELCFNGAPPEEVERCQLDPSIPLHEAEAIQQHEAATGQACTTTIAHALTRL